MYIMYTMTRTVRNGVELATLFDQNHVDNHKNSMVGQSVLTELEQGDRIQVRWVGRIQVKSDRIQLSWDRNTDEVAGGMD